MPKLRQKNRLWTYTATEEDMNAVRWCIKRGIFVSPLSANRSSTSYYIEITKGGKTHQIPKTFSPEEAGEVIYNYYKHFYKQRKDGSS